MNYFIIIPFGMGLACYILAYFFQKKEVLCDLLTFLSGVAFITVLVQIIHSDLTEDIPVVSKIASFILYGTILTIGLIASIYSFYLLVISLKHKFFR